MAAGGAEAGTAGFAAVFDVRAVFGLLLPPCFGLWPEAGSAPFCCCPAGGLASRLAGGFVPFIAVAVCFGCFRAEAGDGAPVADALRAEAGDVAADADALRPEAGDAVCAFFLPSFGGSGGGMPHTYTRTDTHAHNYTERRRASILPDAPTQLY